MMKVGTVDPLWVAYASRGSTISPFGHFFLPRGKLCLCCQGGVQLGSSQEHGKKEGRSRLNRGGAEELPPPVTLMAASQAG